MAGMTSRHSLLAIAVAAALAGCALAPSQLTGESTVPTLAESTTATVKSELSIERWWTLFGDPALERLVEEALAHNADLESAAARVREARAVLDQARASQMPTLDASARASREHQAQRTYSRYNVALEAGYEVDLWGRLSSISSVAKQQLLATEWARAAFEWSLTGAVAEAYFGLAAVDRQVEISQAVRNARASTVQLRRREYAVGAGNEFDLRRAEAELTGTDADLAALGRQRVSLEHALVLLAGRTPVEIVNSRVERNRLDEAVSFNPVLPQGAAADLLVRRPDIRQAEAQLQAANANIDAARAATLPSLRLSGSIGNDTRSVSDLFSGPAAFWSLAAGLTQPIFDGGRLRARVREEQARGEQAFSNYKKSVATAVADVQEAYANLDLAHQALQAERERVASLARAYDLARRGHAAGALNTIDLIDSERSFYQAQLQQVSAYRDQLVGQVAAFKALGGGYANTGSVL
jgi:outer membrane protein, multidrug efflux system